MSKDPKTEPKLKRTKTCRDCRALDGTNCSLGFKTHTERIPCTPVQEAVPDEPCYKPKTNRYYMDLLKMIRESNGLHVPGRNADDQ